MEQKRTNKTDSPLKRLVELAPVDFAEWLLDTKVVNIRSATIELQPNPNATYSDLVFWVTVELSEEEKKANVDNRLLLHIEFQGASSERPMRFLVLDYLMGFADKERGTRIHSVVFYIGEKTNVTDAGHHRVMGIGERVTLGPEGSPHYDTIWLWNLKPQELLDVGRPALLPLLGQAKLERPEEIIPIIYQEIRSLPDEETQHRLLIELLALLRDEEIIQIIETMMAQDEWVFDSPYLRRWRQQVEDAHTEGIQIGLQQGLEEGRMERERFQHERKIFLESQRQSTLKLIAFRYKISVEEYLRLLSSISSIEKLNAISDSVIPIEDFGQFYLYVEEIVSSEKEEKIATA